MDRNGSIGFFDSGLGGISILRGTRRLLPAEDYLYYGDSFHAPYGVRSPEEVQMLSRAITEQLLERGAKAIVIACNTATSAAAAMLREQYPNVPIIGTEPALKPAVLGFPGGNILVTATELTLREQKFRHLLHCYEGKAQIYVQPLGRIVEFVERGLLDSEELTAYLEEVLSPWTAIGLDAIVLGCTHFPFALKQIRQIVGERTAIIDGAAGTVREALRQLERRDLLTGRSHGGIVEMIQSGSDGEWLRRAKELLDTRK